jgi:murein DD-endopeptidase MepM/ murein hydrolase activator NlpD
MKLSARFFIAAALFFLFTAGSLEAAAPQSRSDLEKQIQAEEQQLKKITSQIAAGNKKLREAKEKEKKAINEINLLANRLAEAEQRLNVTVLKRNQIQAKLADTQKKIDDTNRRMENAKKLLSGRMVAVYKYGGAAEFNVFMSATGAQDALSTSYLLSRMAEQDRALIAELSTQKTTLDSAMAELVKQKAEMESRNKELEKQRVTIQRTTQERNKLLNQARKDKALYQAEQEELLRASNELKGKVNQLLSEKKKMQQRNNTAATPVYHKGGKLAWPLRGKITSPYGTRVHPVFKTRTTHTGLDIDGNKGDPVRAAAAGEVLYTGWLRGYGQVVIVDHGGNLTTVYAHLSGIDTMENAKVKAGDKIGRVGSTGVATGNHLHFEVRVDGNTTDPMKYLQ